MTIEICECGRSPEDCATMDGGDVHQDRGAETAPGTRADAIDLLNQAIEILFAMNAPKAETDAVAAAIAAVSEGLGA